MNLDYVLTFSFVALAVYRMSIMLSTEAGPWDMLARLRDKAGQATMLGKLIRCPFCLSIWFGLAGAFVLPYYNGIWFIVSALALSAVATLLVKRWG